MLDKYKKRELEQLALKIRIAELTAIKSLGSGHVGGSLFDDEPVMNGNLVLYATYDAPDRPRAHDLPAAYPSEVPPGRDTATYETTVTERMTETVATLKAMDIEAAFG